MGADPVAEFEAYKRNLLEHLGDRDPLAVLAETDGEVAARIVGLDEERASARPEPGAWSAKEIVGHLADTEWAFGFRIRHVLSHEDARIEAYDQDLMVTALRHNERTLFDVLGEFGKLRVVNLELYRRMQGDPWQRVGLHSERGAESVELWIRLLAGHDLRHLNQLDRTLGATR